MVISGFQWLFLGGYGGTGRRTGLKILRASARAGSIPATRTILFERTTTMTLSPDELYTAASNKIDQIEAELKKIGYWENTPLPPEKFENMGAFSMNTMAASQWVQFVLIPRVRSIVAERGQLPPKSNVGVWGVKNFEQENEEHLLQLLSEFDLLFWRSDEDEVFTR